MSQFVLALILGAAIALFSYFAKLLARSGSIATFLLAFFIFWLGGWQWTVPIMAFFLLSSLLSKTGKERKKQFAETFEKTDTRDAMQVIANGGMGAMALAAQQFVPDFPWYVVYLSTIACVTADTWATEIGVLSHGQPRFIIGWKPVGHGTSGAVSVIGTLGGFAGAAVIAGTGALFAPLPLSHLLLIIIIGGLGNLVDSFFGATMQAMYECTECSARTEKAMHHGKPARLVHGFVNIRNDTVNFMASAVAAMLAVIGLGLVVTP